MEQGFIDILQKLIKEQGKEALLDASKCKAFLADYTRNEFKKESRFLLQALDAGVQRAIDASRELPICKKQQIRLLHEDYGLVENVAVDIVDTLAFVLRGDTTRTEMQGTDNVPGADQTVKKKPSAPAAVPAAAAGIEPLVKRGYLFLEDADWKQADTYFDRVLDMDPEYAPAYIGKLCAELKLREEEQLAQNEKPLTGYKSYQKAVRFANAKYRVKIEQYNETIQDRIAEEERQKRAEKERQAAAKAGQGKREKPERERLTKEKAAKYKGSVVAGNCCTFGLKADGTVVAAGSNEYGECNVVGWRGIVAVATGGEHTVGLKADGTVVTVGNNEMGRCIVGGWRDITAVAAGKYHTAGLKADGTVVAVGGHGHGEANVRGWRDIAEVIAGKAHTVGLKKDGTVVAVGDNSACQCNVSTWRDIAAVAAGSSHTVGLKADGTVVAVGGNLSGKCNVSGWRDIAAVAAGEEHTVGLKKDGTVVAVGDNQKGQCNVSGWRDIAAVAAGSSHTVGLKADGTVVAVGDNGRGQCNVRGWRDIGPASEEQAKELIEGMEREKLEKKELEAARKAQAEKEAREAEAKRKAKAAQAARWQARGLCTYCGGKLALFTRKCKDCGRKNYYTAR